VAAKLAKVFKNGRSQAVRIPKEFRLDTDQVLIERKGKRLVLTPQVKPARRYKSWADYWKNAPRFTDDYPDYVPDPPPKPIKGF
jgi:antitoxin VapB